MNIIPVSSVIPVNNNIKVMPEKTEKPVENNERKPYMVNMQTPTAQLLRAFMGIKTQEEKQPAEKDPYGARAFLNNHPASPYVQGENRENLIAVMEEGSVETSNVEMQLQLIADGKLTPQTLSHYWKTGKMCDQMEADIEMMYDCYANGLNVDDVYCPQVSNFEEGNKNTKIGDVFKVENEDMIYVKDSEESSHQLKVDKETFIKLFPPAQRFASAQYAIGDCYLVSGLNTVMENPKTRVALYDAFEQDGENLHVKYPNGKADYYAPKGKVQEYTNPRTILRGALGMQLLEDAFGLELKVKAEDDFRTTMAQKIEDKQEEYKNANGVVEKFYLNNDLKVMTKRLQDFEESLKNPANQTVVLREDTGEDIVYKEDKYGMQFAKMKEAPEYGKKGFTMEKEFYRGALGGYQGQLMDVLGIKGVQYETVRDREKILEMLDQEPSGKFIICGGTWPDGSRTENPIATDKGIYSFHGYTLEAFKDDAGDIKVRGTNPWNTAMDADMSIDEFFEFFQLAAFFEVDSYQGINRENV
ncbi:hypothetical protein IJG14_01055 [bacterium]|nr:hypothetical protein [bacterium]